MVQEPFKPSLATPVGQSPLQEFIAILDSWEAETRETPSDTPGEAPRKYQVITFNFKDLDVIESLEPYPFPIAVLNIGYAPPTVSRGNTRWEALAGSLRKLTPDPDLDVLTGKRQTWKMLPAQLRQPVLEEDGTPKLDGRLRPIWADADVACWHITEVEGLGSTAESDEEFMDFLVEQADGKLPKDWYEALLGDRRVTQGGHGDIVTSITERRILDTLLLAGKLTQDTDGVLHKA